MKKLLLWVLFSSFLSQLAYAESDNTKGFYLGGGIGNSTGEISDDNYSEDLGLNNNAYHIIAGYQVNKNFTVEAQYINYGLDDYEIMEPTSLSLSANLGYSFETGFRPFVLLGLGVSQINFTESVPGFDDSGISLHYGLGLGFSPAGLPNLTFRLAYEADYFELEIDDYRGYQVDMFDITLSSTYAGLTYKF